MHGTSSRSFPLGQRQRDVYYQSEKDANEVERKQTKKPLEWPTKLFCTKYKIYAKCATLRLHLRLCCPAQ